MSNTIAPDAGTNAQRLTRHAQRLVRRLKWLSPIQHLASSRSRDFGRSIEKSLLEISTGDGVKLLKLRQKDTAVVMSLAHYEDIIQLKELCAELIETSRKAELHDAENQFDSLYQRISCSRKGADALFSASAADLAASYQPGQTESH